MFSTRFDLVSNMFKKENLQNTSKRLVFDLRLITQKAQAPDYTGEMYV